MRARIQAFIKEATHMVDHGTEALQHLERGDKQSACDVISMAAYKMSHAETEWNGILGAFRDEGIEPGGGR